MSLLSEGSKEFRRILFRREPLPIYKPERYRLTLDIASSSEYVPWRDRAFDLVQLRWSHYVFRRETGWLDAETCWTGRNMNTSATVLLWCISKSLTDSTLQDLIRRSDRIMIDSGESSLEVIFAVEEGDLESTESLIRSSKGLELRLETEATMLDGLVDWTDYRNYIRKRMCETRLQDSDLTVSDVFVEPHISGVGQKDDKSYRLEQYLNVWLEERSQRHVAILGDYGQGKSTAALAFAYSQLSREGAERIPILLELRGRSPRNMKPLELVATWSATYNINPQALMYLHRAGRLVLIFEGFDEMELVGDAEMRLKHFGTLWEFCRDPRSKILITGRPNFFFDEEEMTVSLGISVPSTERPYCAPVRLKPFMLPQIERALRECSRAVRDEICSFAKKDEQFRELISRPSLLHVVSVLWSRENLSDKLNELTSAYIMGRFVRYSYRRQGLKPKDTPGFMALTTEERQYFMKGVATYMAAHDLQNQIGGRNLNNVVAALFDAIPEVVSRRTPAITGESRQPLRARVGDREGGLEHVQTDVRTCGILVDDPSATGVFQFGHKSFMEYLFAEVVANHVVDEQTPDAPSILAACKASPAKISDLPVSTRFLSELIGTNVAHSAGQVAEQKRLARRILRLLMGRKLSSKYVLFRQSLVMSARTLPKIFRPLVQFIDPLVVPIVLYGWIVIRAFDSLWLIGSIGIVAGVVFQLASLSVIIGAWSNRRSATVRSGPTIEAISTWNGLCRELGFQDRVLFQIAGIGWLFWTRGQAFDFFLRTQER